MWPERGRIVIGFAKPKGGTGGYARYIAVAPPERPHGVSVNEIPGAPLPLQPHTLKRDENGVMRPSRVPARCSCIVDSILGLGVRERPFADLA